VCPRDNRVGYDSYRSYTYSTTVRALAGPEAVSYTTSDFSKRKYRVNRVHRAVSRHNQAISTHAYILLPLPTTPSLRLANTTHTICRTTSPFPYRSTRRTSPRRPITSRNEWSPRPNESVHDGRVCTRLSWSITLRGPSKSSYNHPTYLLLLSTRSERRRHHERECMLTCTSFRSYWLKIGRTKTLYWAQLDLITSFTTKDGNRRKLPPLS